MRFTLFQCDCWKVHLPDVQDQKWLESFIGHTNTGELHKDYKRGDNSRSFWQRKYSRGILSTESIQAEKKNKMDT